MKKTLAIGGALLLLSSFAFGMVGCEEKKPQTTGARVPKELREGYEEKFDGFVSRVHWIENRENGKRIYGRLFLPDGFDEKKEYSTLIMSHGYNASGEGGNNSLIQNVMAKGMIAYTYDFCGGARLSKSEGKTTEMTFKTEISDLESVFYSLRAEAYTKDDKMALFGQSFGGLVTSLTAAYHKDDIAAVILQAPAIAYDVYSLYESKDDIPETVENQFMTVSRDFYLAFWDFDILGTIKGWDKDILVTVGTADSLLDGVCESVKVYGDKCKLVVVEDAPHSFQPRDFAIVMPDINAYLEKMGII